MRDTTPAAMHDPTPINAPGDDPDPNDPRRTPLRPADTVRLAKRVADAFACSRREAEQYIEGGWISVDGAVLEEPGARVVPGQAIAMLPQATLLVHKPAGMEALGDAQALLALITPAQRAADDRSGQRLLQKHLRGLTLATPLGKVASGLVVLTQDFRVARKLVDDAVRIEHEFIVEVTGAIAADGLQRLNEGIPLPGRPPGTVKVSWQNETRLRFAAKALKTGHVTLMCDAVGLQVKSMRRIRVGRIAMAGLASGHWRYLLGYERF
jgi:23S rRNA pseudouridine2604 synthase